MIVNPVQTTTISQWNTEGSAKAMTNEMIAVRPLRPMSSIASEARLEAFIAEDLSHGA